MTFHLSVTLATKNLLCYEKQTYNGEVKEANCQNDQEQSASNNKGTGSASIEY